MSLLSLSNSQLLFVFVEVPDPCPGLFRELKTNLDTAKDFMFPEWLTRATLPISTSSVCVWVVCQSISVKVGPVIFTEADLPERERMGLYCCHYTGPLQVPCLFSLSPLPHDTALKKWKGKSSLKLFLFLFWFQGKTPELCFRISIIPSITKTNHFLFLILRRGAETKQETDPDSPISFACMEFTFKSLPKITLKGWKMLWLLQQLRRFIIGFTSLNYFWVWGNIERKRIFKGQWYVLVSLILWNLWTPGHFSSVLQSPHIC